MSRRFLSQLPIWIVIASILTVSASRADAQGKPAQPSKVDDKVIVLDSATVQDIQKAAEQLAQAVEAAVRKATEDPAVKVAALKVAKSAVAAAQVAITQQAETLQTVLDNLAKEIAAATERQHSGKRSH